MYKNYAKLNAPSPQGQAQAYAENLVLIYYVYGVHMYRSVDGVVVRPWRALLN